MIKTIHACNRINFSSNINEVIRTVLNFLLFMIRFHKHKKALKALKALNVYKQNQVKSQNADKQISNFFRLRCFLYVFFLFLFNVSGFVLFCACGILS